MLKSVRVRSHQIDFTSKSEFDIFHIVKQIPVLLTLHRFFSQLQNQPRNVDFQEITLSWPFSRRQKWSGWEGCLHSSFLPDTDTTSSKGSPTTIRGRPHITSVRRSRILTQKMMCDQHSENMSELFHQNHSSRFFIFHQPNPAVSAEFSQFIEV